MPFQFKTSGIEQTLEFFRTHAATVSREEDHLMEDFARRIFERSQTLVPVRDASRPDKPPPTGRPHNIPGGSLKQSGQVFKGDAKGEWIIGYGGTGAGTPRDPFYAVYVHEIPQIHLGEGTDHYLSRAVDEFYPDLIQEIGPLVQSRFFGTGPEGGFLGVPGWMSGRYVPIRGDITRTDIGGTTQIEQYRLRPEPTIVEVNP